jgi:hypothetical protein
MRKTFMVAALLVPFVLCNSVSAANYSIRLDEIVTVTYPDNIPRTGIWFTMQDLADYTFPPVESVVKSLTIADQNGQSGTYRFVETPPYNLNENPSDKPEDIVRLEPYYISEWRGNDQNSNGIIEPYQGEYGTRLNAEWQYGIITRNLPVTGGTYVLSVDTGTQTIYRTVSGVPAGIPMPPVTDINAKFDADGRFNVAWKIPDVYVNNSAAYQNAKIQIRVDRYAPDGNKRYWRERVDNLPLFLNGNKFDNYTFFKWESDVLRVYAPYNPYIKVQVRIILQNSRGVSDWKEFKIDGSTVTPTIIPIPLTQAQLDKLMNENISKAYDIQQGGAGLAEIQALLNTPPGQRRAPNSYSGQLGERINTIIQMLLPPGKAKKN